MKFFNRGDRIKFSGLDSRGMENYNGHYKVLAQIDNVVMAIWEGDLKEEPVLLYAESCKKRNFKKKVK